MSNLLPPTAKKTIWREYRSRFLVVGSLAGLVCAAVAFLALSPSYLVLRTQEVAPPVIADSSGPGALAQDRATISRTQALISVLSPLTGTSTPTDVIASALALRPAGVRVNHITVSAGDSGSIVLGGVAVNSAAISAYQSALRGTGRFSSVSVPVSDLAGTENGDFTITLSGAF